MIFFAGLLLLIIFIAIMAVSITGNNDTKNMESKSKIIKMIYLYVAALVSMIFLAVGTGTFFNTALKAYVFPKAEKGGYSRCNQQPPVYELSPAKNSQIASEEQRAKLEQLLKDYETWKQENSGEECYASERQNNFVNSITMIIIALPICLLHWRLIKKNKERENNIG